MDNTKEKLLSLFELCCNKTPYNLITNSDLWPQYAILQKIDSLQAIQAKLFYDSMKNIFDVAMEIMPDGLYGQDYPEDPLCYTENQTSFNYQEFIFSENPPITHLSNKLIFRVCLNKIQAIEQRKFSKDKITYEYDFANFEKVIQYFKDTIASLPGVNINYDNIDPNEFEISIQQSYLTFGELVTEISYEEQLKFEEILKQSKERISLEKLEKRIHELK
jgi:hypothetical protein